MKPETMETRKHQRVHEKASFYRITITADERVVGISMLTLRKSANQRYETAYSVTVSPLETDKDYRFMQYAYHKDGYYESAANDYFHRRRVFNHVCNEIKAALGKVPGFHKSCNDFEVSMLPTKCIKEIFS